MFETSTLIKNRFSTKYVLQHSIIIIIIHHLLIIKQQILMKCSTSMKSKTSEHKRTPDEKYNATIKMDDKCHVPITDVLNKVILPELELDFCYF